MKLLFETLDKIRSIGKSNFEGHIPDIAITAFQQLRPPLEPARTDKISGGFTGQSMNFPVQGGMTHIKLPGQLVYVEFRVR